MSAARLPALLLLSACTVALPACSRSTLAPPDADAPGPDAGVLGDAGAIGDLDVLAPSDTTPDVAPDVFVPPFPTPARSPELDRLYCSLDNGQLVRGAVMASACLELSMAGILDDAARGFVYGPVVSGGYGRSTLGNCDVLACLAAAPDCDAAAACEAARFGDACDPNVETARCEGDTLSVCQWDGRGQSSRWLQVQDCTRMGTVCREIACDPAEGCRRDAVCVGDTPTEQCGYYDNCQGNAAFRCSNPSWSSTEVASFAIDCAQLIDGGICTQTAVGGEAPGVTCAPAEAECQQNFAEGFACNPDGTMQICLFGRLAQINCADYGFSSCTDGFFEQRCIP